ncbi:hypothetical protein AB685_01040 [Bacillus sp. LL01]|uniref:DUF1871 family protein n=1 Tax=Bacillus sp. LL01 TaxID=1665556 RepID=UPI00064D26C7|nr:DUF1871 family protein [Bacillus sp. LL01]KMJ59495.1 hypothetical protein AB685_01040 [Bacillus sp. LL01]
MEGSSSVSMQRKKEIVNKIINDWDPMGLIAMGAREDRYIVEIEQIVDGLYQTDTVDEFAARIKLCLDYSFSTDFSSITCLQVAVLIWEEVNE